ncbi:hypothetical protein BC943DRAFT_90266 [Umbelopsis sp. AD052]|nr:hypothetical protein BC943DRAFT_90266 [Umbelopsis sp. AD052]
MTDDSGSAASSMKSTSRSDASRKPKLFRCTGFGNCDMVFTRSEHLARHARKHTGEKPFQCVVPGCGRMFSRFDNMMQHTQTHSNGKAVRRSKPKSKKSSAKRDSTSSNSTTSSLHKRSISRSSLNSSPEMSSDDSEYMPYKRQRADSASRRESGGGTYRSRSSVDEVANCLPPPSYITHQTIPPVERLIGSWKSKTEYDVTPSPTLAPLSPPMSNESPTGYIALRSWKLPVGSWRRKSVSDRHRPLSPLSPNDADFGILPKLATYLVKNPDKTPESFYRRHHSYDSALSKLEYQRQRNANQTRRLSVADLCNPIESLCQDIESNHQESEERTITLTEDEFEALQGIGRFRVGMVSQERHSINSMV